MKRTPVAATHLGRMEKRRRRRLVGYSLEAAAGWTARTAWENLDRLFFTCTGEASHGEEESSASNGPNNGGDDGLDGNHCWLKP